MLQFPRPEPSMAAGALPVQMVEFVREPLPMLDADVLVRLASEAVADPIAPERPRDFIMLIGHELRNPLSAIIAYAQLMQRRGAYDEQALTAIVAQAGQIDRLVGDLLDSSRLEAGQVQLQRTPVDLVDVARACTEQAQMASPSHRLRLESAEPSLQGSWDRGRLAQVFANLLGNAIKYSATGGEILVQVEDLGIEARVSIEDHGPGIASAVLPHLFDRAYRGLATAAGVPGLGLGLYISKALVEAHGGSIQVESLLGQRTVFSFILPRLYRVPDATEDQMN